jgi:hypothetical protein
MILSELKKLLAENTDRNIRLLLPTGSKVPPHAHVTEVARIDKRFIDAAEHSARKQIAASKRGLPMIRITV